MAQPLASLGSCGFWRVKVIYFRVATLVRQFSLDPIHTGILDGVAAVGPSNVLSPPNRVCRKTIAPAILEFPSPLPVRDGLDRSSVASPKPEKVNVQRNQD